MPKQISTSYNCLLEIGKTGLLQDHKEIFDFAYKHYKQPILESIGFMINDQHAAEDIVHDVFLKLWTIKNSIVDIKDLRAFLWVSAKNQCISLIRRQKSLKVLELEAAKFKMDLACPVDVVIRREKEQLIQLAIHSLPPQRKKIFVLCWMEGWKIKQIADQLKISPFTVKASLQEAKRDIRLFVSKHSDLKRKRILKKLKRVWREDSLKQVA